MSKAQRPNLPLWNDLTADNKLRWYELRPGRELDVPALRVVKPVNDRLTASIYYRNYRLLKESACYYDDVAHELHNKAKK